MFSNLPTLFFEVAHFNCSFEYYKHLIHDICKMNINQNKLIFWQLTKALIENIWRVYKIVMKELRKIII